MGMSKFIRKLNLFYGSLVADSRANIVETAKSFHISQSANNNFMRRTFLMK